MSVNHNRNIMKHRTDIDGLRAFAIIPVLLFHSGFEFFSGGYVGVDVFFTISGFLITSILLKDIDNKQFSYIHFFKRRIRRLMPMAILIYIFVLLSFIFIYPVDYFKDVSAAAFSSLFFFSNMYFWKEGGGYFGGNVEINPLLHTWSLSVEEQFYLIFPFLLVLIFKITQNYRQKIVLVFLGIMASLVVAVIYAPSRESFAAFYLLPPRMYELGVGSLAAMFVYYWPQHDLRKTKYLQEIGLFLVVLPVFLFDKYTQFPSYNALIPCLGTALVMFSAGSKNWSSTLLNSRVAVYIGLISYSLYLWHWPLMVIKNWITGNASTVIIDIFVIVISIVFSAFTYKYIENPFRNKNMFPDKKLMVYASGSFISIGILSVFLYVAGNSFIVDPNGQIDATYQEAIAPSANREQCFEKVRRKGEFYSCQLSENGNTKNKKVFVWGDSHGSAFMPVLTKFSQQQSVIFANNSGCPPVLNIKRTDLSKSCLRINRQIFEHIISNKYDLVVLVGAFSNYLNWGIVGQQGAEHIRNPELAKSDFTQLLSTTLDKFDQAKIPFLIVAQPPRMNNHIPEEFLRVETLGNKYLGEIIPLSEYESQIAPLLASLPSKWQNNLVVLNHVYCPDEECISMKDGVLLYKDQHHISNAYADYLSEFFTRIINAKLTSQN